MSSKQTIKLTDDFAPEYDKHVANSHWTGPELLFNLLQKHIKQGDKLLDIGIGTGLASIPFYQAGLKIHGIDGSSEMLQICRAKNIAEQLIQTDLSKANFKIPDIQYDFIVSNGVFHMIGDISHIIKKASTHLKPGGFICFTVIPYLPNEKEEFTETTVPGIYSLLNKKINLLVFRHTKTYIQNVLSIHKLQILKNQIFLAFKDIHEDREVFFEYFLAIKA